MNNGYIKDIADCIRRFEDILFAYRLDVQVHWQRLIPFFLTHTQCSWYDELRVKKNLSWTIFKEQSTLKYGIKSVVNIVIVLPSIKIRDKN
jgi:hypothetical protein